jgi:thymidine kinase
MELNLKVITGVMTSGKSARLIEEIDKVVNTTDDVYLILKPVRDTRDGAKVKTRKHGRTYPAVLVDHHNTQLYDLVRLGIENYSVVFLDEMQFFEPDFIEELIQECSYNDIKVIASGLSKTFKGDYFPTSKILLDRTDDVEFLVGRCYSCGSHTADMDVLMDKDGGIILDGDIVNPEGSHTGQYYESICSECFGKVIK